MKKLQMLGRAMGRWTGAALAGFGFLALASSCNLIVDTDIEQCQTTADCINKGGKFANSVCTTDKVCSTGGDCTTNLECIGKLGGDAICRQPERTCVALKTAECTEVFPPNVIEQDSTIVLGSIGPLTGPDQSSGLPLWQGIKLALNEIQVNANGLPVKNSTDRRQLAVVACDDDKDPIAVAKHLAQVVRVPVIFGSAFSGATLKVATQVTVPAGTLLFSASATGTALTDLQDFGLFWRTSPPDTYQAIPYAYLAQDLEENTFRDAGPPACPLLGGQCSAKIRVAMTVKGDAYGAGLATAATSLLNFNGLPANDQSGSNFKRYDYPDTSSETGFDFAPIVDDLALTFKPHIIMTVGTTEVINDIITGVEAKWTEPTYKPFYVIPDGGRISELTTLVEGKDELRKRVLGTAPGRTTALYQNFKSAFEGFFKGPPPGTFAANAYDSLYLTAYALVAMSDQQPPSGALVNEGLKLTVGGLAVTAGSSTINTAFSEMSKAGGKIDYDGISGPLDFDVNKGEAAADEDIWCIVPGPPAAFVSSGQFYNAETNKVEGARTDCQ